MNGSEYFQKPLYMQDNTTCSKYQGIPFSVALKIIVDAWSRFYLHSELFQVMASWSYSSE